MLNWLVMLAIGAVAFTALSALAIWAWGRFALDSLGQPSEALGVSGPRNGIDDFVAKYTAGAPEGGNGLALLETNFEAFAARARSARQSGRSLDLMYYIWEEDLSGRLLLAELVAAANRGVRVRLLLDDIGVTSRDDLFLAVNAHPQIEVRLFNPTRARKKSFRRGIEMALRFASVTRRMHNKAWIVDGQIAIAGGRNIGDAYFDAAESSNFVDIDLMCIGPVVQDTEAMFDRYWNSSLALPIKRLVVSDRAVLREIREGLLDLRFSDEARPYIDAVEAEVALVLPNSEMFFWCAAARLVADPPEKALGKKGENWLMQTLTPIMRGAERSLTIVSPYFVPGQQGSAEFATRATEGIEIKVLTNSLAANDVAAVHGGYAPRRKGLLQAGVKLYELRPTVPKRLRFRGSGSASLHTKAFTIDGETGFVGSLNFDPRSASLNTEMGILFEAPDLIARIDAIFAKEMGPDFSYRLSLDDRGDILWHGEAGEIHRSEPQSSLYRRAFAKLVSLLPLESQL